MMQRRQGIRNEVTVSCQKRFSYVGRYLILMQTIRHFEDLKPLALRRAGCNKAVANVNKQLDNRQYKPAVVECSLIV